MIWIAREGPTIVGQYATMPVKLAVKGHEVDASWGMDVMVAPERQRRAWAKCCSAPGTATSARRSGSGLSDSSYRLFQKMKWPDVGPVPCLVKPLIAARVPPAAWPVAINRFVSLSRSRWSGSWRAPARSSAEVRVIRVSTRLHATVGAAGARSSTFAVRRDAAYLNWKFATAPHVRYTIAALVRDGETGRLRRVPPRARAARARHAARRLPGRSGRRGGLATLLRWIDREARAGRLRQDPRRSPCTPASGGCSRKSGYFVVKSTMEFVARSTPAPCPAGLLRGHRRWHVTLGDSDQDR